MKILFICTHNRCRSILAEAITKNISQSYHGSIEVKSAGSTASGKVHNLTIENLKRHGYETNNLQSQSWENLGDFKPDICITVCDSAAKEACPTWLGKAIKIHWGLADPSNNNISTDQSQIAFDEIIALLEKRIIKTCQLDIERMTITRIETEFNKIGEII